MQYNSPFFGTVNSMFNKFPIKRQAMTSFQRMTISAETFFQLIVSSGSLQHADLRMATFNKTAKQLDRRPHIPLR